MHPQLQLRYGALFAQYGSGYNPVLYATKQYFIEKIDPEKKRFRPDASLFLLVSVDHLIIRPYFGHVPTTENPLGLSLPPLFYDESSITEAVYAALDVIAENIPGKEPHSSHDVIRSIDLNWESLEKQFFWN